jgi:EAL domain-containing protein (putative c-di-GMP-specific phosphodiesterase class I)
MFSPGEIRAAFEKGEFFLEYLPTMLLSTNQCAGAEALIRWRKATGTVFPMEFIPAIENTPLSGAITYWVIDTLALELRSWLLGQDHVRISINIPPEIVGRGGIAYALKKSQLADVADKLMLEVTERGLPDALGIAGLSLAANSDTVMLALDDVSLSDVNLFVLSRVPAHVIKLDKSFADSMLQADWSDEKIAGLAALIRDGNVRVIVEGIEKPEQVKIVKDAGVQMAQGFYFSPPLPAQGFIDFFMNHR